MDKNVDMEVVAYVTWKANTEKFFVVSLGLIYKITYFGYNQ